MIVDLDTRLWSRSDDLGDELGVAVRRSASTRWLAPDASPEAYTGAMATVDAAMLVGFRSDLIRGALPEAPLRAAVEKSQGRLFFARAIDPTARDAVNEVDSARDAGAVALWLDPALQGFHPSSTPAMRVFDRAEANQLPVLVGWSGPAPASMRLEYARPFMLDEVARAFPRLSIVISGFGFPFVHETLAMLAKHDRVFTTTAAIAARPWDLLNTLQSARDHGVDRKIFFASGFPFDSPARAIESIYGINGLIHGTPLPSIARSILREIVERDAISLLGLGTPPIARDRDARRMLARELPYESPHLGLTGDSL